MQTGFLLSFILLGFLSLISLAISLYIKRRYSKKKNTPKELINELLHKMQLSKNDTFVDLGAGDFRIVFEAQRKTGARSVGIEISPLLVFFAKVNKIKRFGVDRNPEIRIENLLKTDLSTFTVLYANLDDNLLLSLIETIKKSGRPDSNLYLLNAEFPGVKFNKKIKLDEKNSLFKYSVNKIKES